VLLFQVNSAISPLSSMQLKSQQPTVSDTKDLSLRQTFKCHVQELYNVFTIPEVMVVLLTL
jgi:activator of HSP90 ATPase